MKKILIVDDSQDDTELMRSSLSASGFDVVSVEDGKFALSGIERHNPDLVVLDIFMPHQEGAETLIQIKKAHPELPVITVSGDGAFYLPIMKELGADGVVLKSSTYDELASVVTTFLK